MNFAIYTILHSHDDNNNKMEIINKVFAMELIDRMQAERNLQNELNYSFPCTTITISPFTGLALK